MIQIIGNRLSQWDVGRLVEVTGEASHVHFANQGDSKTVIIDIEEGKAKIPDYLLQTGKTLLAYAVLNGVTLESYTFAVRKRERPENYVYEDDQRNYIYALIQDAESAIARAGQNADEADRAAREADIAADEAREAYYEAKAASSNANAAADNANKAATNAAHTAKSLMVVGKTEGEVIALDDAIDQFLVGCRIFGKTTQDGTPTPSAPVDLVSVGESGSITVNVTGENDAQSMTIATPNGLPGVPVNSGGNYTDANGQQWTCDEIDFARGVYVQRTEKVDMGTISWWYDSDNNRFLSNSLNDKVKRGTRVTSLMTSVGYDCKHSSEAFAEWGNAVYVAGPTLYIHDANYTTLEPFTAAVKGVMLLYPFENPIETPLSEEELASFAALRTYRNSTTVSNDASAHMEIEYVMDAKKYIDRMIAAGGGSIIPATVE